MAFKDELKRLRTEAGLTQRKLSELSGVSYSYLTKLESGAQNNPTFDTLEALGKALNAPLGAIFDFSDDFSSSEGPRPQGGTKDDFVIYFGDLFNIGQAAHSGDKAAQAAYYVTQKWLNGINPTNEEIQALIAAIRSRRGGRADDVDGGGGDNGNDSETQ